MTTVTGEAFAVDARPGAPSLVGRDVLVLSPTPTWPLDAGNRKRVHRICTMLRDRGARIHFVYYPFEWWFTSVPQAHLDRMAAQWDSFHLVPATRPLQSPPAGEHHTIDEWWDPAIEPMLTWLLHRGSYDAFIVNYAYLSRALDMAPAGTLKILDTHDRFSDRKEVLGRMGVAPEYFYTRADQEAVALNRADLVWAIKEEEAEFFRTLCDRPVITMPHAEDPVDLVPRPVDDDTDLVIGMVGARNSLNLHNALRFIDEAMPVLRRRLAPVRIRFGGGMCADLEDLDPLPAGVELAGRFDEPAEFYGGVDAIVVPMSHSTGLKIKAVEAFALGLPVIAHRHAVEGIPVSHRFHRCESMSQIAECCMALVRDRGLLDDLRAATRQTRDRLAAAQVLAMDATARRIAEPLSLVMTVAPEFVDPDSPYGQHVFETIDYIRYLGPVILYVDRPLPGAYPAWCQRFNWRADHLKIALAPAAAAAMKLQPDRRKGEPFPLFHSVEALGSLLSRLPHRVLWVTDLPDDLTEDRVPAEVLTPAFVRIDALDLLDRWSPQEISEVLERMPSAIPIGWVDAQLDERVPPAAAARARRVPFWRDLAGGRLAPWRQEPSQPHEVWITASAERPMLALGWALALRVLQPALPPVRLLFRDQASLEESAALLAQHVEVRAATVQSAISTLVRRQHRPRLTLDVAADACGFAVLHESCWRLGLPWLQAWSEASDGAMHGILDPASRPTRLGSLLREMAELLTSEPDSGRTEPRVLPAFANDAGWQWVWKAVAFRKAVAL